MQLDSKKVSKIEDFDAMIETLCHTAKVGLLEYYKSDGALPYTTGLDDQGRWSLKGESIRYAAISQIGIAKWIKSHPQDSECLPGLWPRISAGFETITHIGDMALSVWAGVDSQANDVDKFVKALVKLWLEQAGICNAVELGWVVQACTRLSCEKGDLSPEIEKVLKGAHGQLADLFNSQSSLFQRHNRGSMRQAVSRRVACFADQVYPIVAMSNYGMVFNDQRSIEMASSAVDQICKYQGQLGQWQWHYDVSGNKLSEEYPVFSVHQDSMAPMAILIGDKASNANHLKEIELGVRWLFGANELQQDLVLQDQGIVWRDIERCEPEKFSRSARGLCCVLGLKGVQRYLGNLFSKFKVNYECRPYHLGWILYAWADFEK